MAHPTRDEELEAVRQAARSSDQHTARGGRPAAADHDAHHPSTLIRRVIDLERRSRSESERAG